MNVHIYVIFNGARLVNALLRKHIVLQVTDNVTLSCFICKNTFWVEVYWNLFGQCKANMESEQTFTLTAVVFDYTISSYQLRCILDQSFPLHLWVSVEAKQSGVALGCAPHSPQPMTKNSHS